MGDFNFSWQNVIDGNGIGLAIAGMIIVFTSLSLISAIIALLPYLMKYFYIILPEEVTQKPTKENIRHADSAVIAAISLALATQANSTSSLKKENK